MEQAKAQECYVTLNRTIESGHASDETWRELSRVCAVLQKREEALRAAANIRDPGTQLGVRRFLARHGIGDAKLAAEEQQRLIVTDADLAASIRDRLGEAVTYLTNRPVPTVAGGGTIAFLIAMGFGALLTAGSGDWWLRLLAMTPGLAVFGAVGAYTRRVLEISAQGLDDAPELVDAGPWSRDAVCFLKSFALIGGVCVGPAIAAGMFGLSLVALGWLVVAAVPLTAASVVRAFHSDWHAISVRSIAGAVRAGGRGFFGVAVTCALLLAPASIAFTLACDLPMFSAIGVTGPLLVVPLLVAARLLGQYLHSNPQMLKGAAGSTGKAEPKAAKAGPGKRRKPPAAGPQGRVPARKRSPLRRDGEQDVPPARATGPERDA